MPINKRRYAPKRKMVRRKQYARRSMLPISRRPNLYHMKRKVFYQDAIVVSATTYANAWSFNLSQLPNYTDFTNLYDQYRINKIVFKIIPKFSEASINAGTANNANLAQIHSVIDYDDAVTPTALSDLVQYQSYP